MTYVTNKPKLIRKVLTVRFPEAEEKAMEDLKHETGIPLQQQVVRAVKAWLVERGYKL